MKRMKQLIYLALLIFLLPHVKLLSQQADSFRTQTLWNAKWIGASDPEDSGLDYGVYYFRKKINVSDQPSHFSIHVSADNHYKLYVNGRLVSIGPAHGTIQNWKYETLDIARYLHPGENLVAAMVWNEGQYRPEAQFSLRTGFILQGHSSYEEMLNTDDSWVSIRDSAFKPILGFYAAINAQRVDMNKKTHHWNENAFNDSSWPSAKVLFPGQPKGLSDGFGYLLVPSLLAARSLVYQPISLIRQSKGIKASTKLKLPITIPPNSDIEILMDQRQETNAYPTIVFSGARNATLTLGYSEALYEKGSNFRVKGNRNQVEGMEFKGLTDSIISDGTDRQRFTPFYFRTFRYVRLRIQTNNSSLTLDSLYGTFTAYPFKAEAAFNTDDQQIQKILDIGWHTARLNAFDMYFTGQYYERLQYIGDARIQALISFFYSHDDRLTKNAINQIDESRLSDGITLSRSPSRGTQVIAPFSLFYIGMLHDYWMYRNDSDFIKNKLPGEREILGFFSRYQGKDGSLVNLPFWNFTDWAKGTGWGFGTPPLGDDGGSAILDLQLLWGYQLAADMEARIGLHYYADLYRQKSDQLITTIRKKYWDSGRQLFADTKEKSTFSQHANALAILTGVVIDSEKLAFSKRLIADSSLTKCSMYFSYYLNSALIKGGLGNEYLNLLQPWIESIKMGLTTWAEEPDLKTTRSDCHAWSSSPNIEFYRTVLGIDSDAPGFSSVKIEPFLGKMTSVSGKIPHPDGEVKVSYKKENTYWNIVIFLPEAIKGVLKWKGKSYQLTGGKNSFKIKEELNAAVNP